MRGKIFLAVVIGCVMATGAAYAQQTSPIVQKSVHNVAITVARLESAIKQRGASIVAKVDHSAAAKVNDMDLRPTFTLIFGNPKLGTPLMNSNQAAALDLPLKIAIWEDASGATMVAYWPPEILAGSHSIQDKDSVIRTMSGALRAITAEAVMPK